MPLGQVSCLAPGTGRTLVPAEYQPLCVTIAGCCLRAWTAVRRGHQVVDDRQPGCADL